ncbi:hypothetical protein QBC41DRAFT_377944 [Cercophora samala]|uniref:Zn(2)-C6 fungal-type domain-containing protein n=1 Tax=Cercophora samala TaxID=330535 RepID=A0AA39ZNG3_9PEZI|nr:hypothetical protein QBC41DRAFT_377944 [Cercophora samala]
MNYTNNNNNNEMDPNLSAAYPLLGLDATTEAPDFDYAAFYHQQPHHSHEDIDYLAEESSASASTSGNLISSASDATLQTLNPVPPPSLLTVPALPSNNTNALALHNAHSPGNYGQAYPQNQLQLPSFDPSSVSGTGYNDGSSGGGSPAPSSGHGGGSREGGSGSGSGGLTAAGKQRLERRGHTKSRRGCFNCKRRRIKVIPPPSPFYHQYNHSLIHVKQCQETRPSCGHCLKTGLTCEYPSLPTIIHQPSNTLPLFSLLDLRLYHHFLSTCYPHHPIGSEPLWLHTIPHLSQSHPYLMHAILGYSASHLLQSDPTITLTPAMSHRLKAIKSIKKALSSLPTTSSSPQHNPPSLEAQGNALMATCFTLTYQSTLLDDGMPEYMTFIRGVVIVSISMMARQTKLIFDNLLPASHNKSLLEQHMRSLPLVKKEWVDAAVASLHRLERVVPRGGGCQRRYWELLVEMAEGLYKGGWEGYEGMTRHYTWWMMLPQEEFRVLVEVPGDQVSVLLGAHWVAIKMIMAVVTEGEMMGSAERERRVVVGEGGEVKEEEGWKEGKDPRRRMEEEGGPREGIGRWLRWLNRETKGGWRGYGGWTRWVEERLKEDLGYFGKSV